MSFLSLINGKFTKYISILDRGLAYGDGFFETMKWRICENNGDPKVEFWNRHFNRINKGCNLLKINIPTEKVILNHRNKLLEKAKKQGLDSGILKLIITRGEGGRGYRYDKGMKPNIIFLHFESKKISSRIYLDGVKVIFCSQCFTENTHLSGFKHLNRLDSIITRAEWDDDGIFEGLVLDKDKNIVEGTMTNIFFIKDNVLFTPKICSSGIKGIMREIVIDKMISLFEGIRIEKLSKSRLLKADSIFLTNSIVGLVPVKQVNKLKFNIDDSLQKFRKKINQQNNLEMF